MGPWLHRGCAGGCGCMPWRHFFHVSRRFRVSDSLIGMSQAKSIHPPLGLSLSSERPTPGLLVPVLAQVSPGFVLR